MTSHPYYSAQLEDEHQVDKRKSEVTAEAADAFLRLLTFAEKSHTNQGCAVAKFIASVLGARLCHIYDLRALDLVISDDVLLCLDAIRWGRCDMTDMVPDGLRRCIAVCQNHGLMDKWEEDGVPENLINT